MSERLEVRAFPRNDEAFLRLVEETVRRVAPCDPDVLAELIRARYPSARIVPQSSLGAIGHSTVWYAYRDGVAIPADH